MHFDRTHRRTPTAPGRRRAGTILVAALLGLAAGALAARGQTGGWIGAGALGTGDPVYNRPYLFQGTCYLSSIGTSVYFDVHELVLEDPAAPADLSANLCAGTGFDSVLFLYQWSDGRPGGFNAAQPCARLVAYNDDFCGSQSALTENDLVPGFVTVVVTSYLNGTAGGYQVAATSAGSPLGDFIFYSGFETGDARGWSFQGTL